MKERFDNRTTLNCRNARKRFSAMTDPALAGTDERAVLERHIGNCERCAQDYRVFALTRTLLDAAASPEPISPGEDFFVALRVRIERGPEQSAARQVARSADDPWASMLMAAARQLIPAMAMFLILIIGASLLWQTAPDGASGSSLANRPAVRPSERVIFNDVYDIARPTPDDVLETLVAVEERTNGK